MLRSADLLIDLCACYLLSGFRKAVCAYTPFLKGRSLLLCSSCASVLDLLLNLLPNWHLEGVWMYSDPDENYLPSCSVPLLYPSPFLPSFPSALFYFLPLCFKVWTKCFEKIWNIDSGVWFIIIQEQLFKCSRVAQAFHISILPTKVISLSICPLY